MAFNQYYGSGYSNESDPRKLAANQRQSVANNGDALFNANQEQFNTATDQAGNSQNYLHGIEDPLARGIGGYNGAEQQQIQGYNPDEANRISGYSPEEQSRIQGYSPDEAARISGYSPQEAQRISGYNAQEQQQIAGYSPEEASAIGYSPQDIQNIKSQAAQTAGAATAAGADVATRAANAAGGNPAAVAAYRARAAQQSGVQAGNAATNAAVAAKTAQGQAASNIGQTRIAGATNIGNKAISGAENIGQTAIQGAQNVGNKAISGAQDIGQKNIQGAQTIGNARMAGAHDIGQTRIGQQNQALGYYQGLEQQQNQNAQNAANRQTNVYGTQTSGTNQASGLGFQASQTPTTFDKVTGAIAGAAAGAGLEDGGRPSAPPGYEGQQPERPAYRAVVAEGGPEAVVDMASHGAEPYFADDGMTGSGEGDVPETYGMPQGTTQQGDDQWSKTPFWKQMAYNVRNKMANQDSMGTQPRSNGPASGGFNPVSTYSNIGKTVGGLAKLAFADDGVTYGDSGAIFTRPTEVELNGNEAAVPLSYRSTAKARPSMAMPLINQIQKRKLYGGAHAR